MRKQNGYAALLLLLTLLSIFAGHVSYWGNAAVGSVVNAKADAQLQSLLAARDALLGYAANYAFLYGPAGAGPGHLPCPDTDGQAQSDAAVSFARDGPDPPCGAQTFANGKLPRHISLPGFRLAFHTQPAQTIDYRVSGRFINNPVNRVVNSGVVSRNSSYDPVAAVLSTKNMRVVISDAAVIEVTRPAVAAWFIDRMNQSGGSSCLRTNLLSQTELAPKCRHIARWVEQCDYGNIEQALRARSDAWLLLLADDIPVEDKLCTRQWLLDLTLEGVTAARHWFVRNQWQAYIGVDAEESEDCSDDVHSHCYLAYRESRYAVHGKTTELLGFYWVSGT